ncbi:hypothetical protein B9Z19DRAFT_1118395 [Tuber borchii]|uniref:Uncharacterized protein n=1 Tax=Tuber borchii TaxID=42251 RepID=A0A2T7A8N9_TUBBO|nr:hypothetical protein B9Z19DRAFT_1118395 [Tuber borchii]
MSRSKRSKKAANRKKHRAKGNSEKVLVASESEADTASDAGGPVTDNAGEPANRAVDGAADLELGVSSSLDESAVSSDCGPNSCKLKADTAVNNEARNAGDITKRAVDDDVDLMPGVSSSLNESAVSSDCGSDSCKLKTDTTVNHGARYAGGDFQRMLGSFSACFKLGAAFSRGFYDGVNEADALRNRADEGGHADSNQSSGKMGFKDKAGDRHNKKGVGRKRIRPNAALTEEEEAFITGSDLPIYLIPAMQEVIESRKNYKFLRKQGGSGKARILFEENLARHGLVHAPNGVDSRLFPKRDASSKDVPSERSDLANPDDSAQASLQEGLSTSPEVKEGISGTD